MRPTSGTSRVKETIKKAEKHIAAGELDRAKNLLEDAHAKEPGNEYINAILERVMLLGTRVEEPPVVAEAKAESPVEVEDEVQTQVKRLTAMAHDLYERGSYDTAFDSLMKAFMLDPLSKDVVREESVIVPAFELMKKRGTLTTQQIESRPTTAQILQQGLSAQVNVPSTATQVSRLDQLKHQKEQERLALEREMWRKASEIPRISEVEGDFSTAAEPQVVPTSLEKPKEGLLSRLRGGFHIG